MGEGVKVVQPIYKLQLCCGSERHAPPPPPPTHTHTHTHNLIESDVGSWFQNGCRNVFSTSLIGGLNEEEISAAEVELG